MCAVVSKILRGRLTAMHHMPDNITCQYYYLHNHTNVIS